MPRMRRDERAYRQHRAGLRAFVASVLGCLLIPLALGYLPRPLPAVGVALAMLCWCLAIFSFLVAVSPAIAYRCPGCRRRLPRPRQARPTLRRTCTHCDVEWDLGWDFGETP